MAAVQTHGLVKRFDTTIAVDGVDLAIAPGEVRGLLGPNGAGKTTLLRMLLGLIRPDAGTIDLFGAPVDTAGIVPLTGVGGFVEDPTFYPYLSARANLRLLSRLDGSGSGVGAGTGAGAGAGAIEARIDAALERVGLEQRSAQRVGGYSTGMRQRLGIAAALLRAPRLLLLDEPTSGLDPAGARAVATLVRELAQDGVAILLSSHQIGELERVCTSFTFLRAGRVVWDGTAQELDAQAPISAFELTTADDDRALAVARTHEGVRAQRSPRGGIALSARQERLDAYVLALAAAGVAVRRLELRVNPLEAMFFALTSDAEPLEQLEPNELAERVLAGT